MKKKNLFLLSGILAFSLISCGGTNVEPNEPTEPEIPQVDPNKPVDPEKPIDPDKPVEPEEPEIIEPETPVEPELTEGKFNLLKKEDIKYTYEDLSVSNMEGVTPNKGDSTIIVVPVNFSDLKYEYSFNTTNINLLDAAFNGTKEDGSNGYWESVSSYYRKSSNGLVNLTYEITDPWTPNMTAYDFVSNEQTEEGSGPTALMQEIFGSVKLNGEMLDFYDKKYDSNADGFCDGIWFVYNSKDKADQNDFWPYVFYADLLDENNNLIPTHLFGNCAVSFFYDNDINGEDSRTAIHETGHMFGLDDYYSYDVNMSGGVFAASGSIDIMDSSTSGDHNAFSKFSLGWIDAKLPTTSGTFTLKPLINGGEAIVLANPKTFTNSAFAEYLILEYYLPLGNNEKDAKTPTDIEPFLQFSEPGIKIWHVDARLQELKFNERGELLYKIYPDINLTGLQSFAETGSFYTVGHSNTRSRNISSERNEDFLTLVSKDNKALYDNDFATNTSLFKVGDKFDIDTYWKFFKQSKFNDGSKVPFKIEVISMNETEATLNIKIA